MPSLPSPLQYPLSLMERYYEKKTKQTVFFVVPEGQCRWKRQERPIRSSMMLVYILPGWDGKMYLTDGNLVWKATAADNYFYQGNQIRGNKARKIIAEINELI